MPEISWAALQNLISGGATATQSGAEPPTEDSSSSSSSSLAAPAGVGHAPAGLTADDVRQIISETLAVTAPPIEPPKPPNQPPNSNPVSAEIERLQAQFAALAARPDMPAMPAQQVGKPEVTDADVKAMLALPHGSAERLAALREIEGRMPYTKIQG